MQEIEQRLKLSTSNIIALIAVLISFVGGYVQLTNKISEQAQRLNSLEKTNDDDKDYRGKIEFKLDKLIESTNQIKVDMAKQNQNQENINKN
jgi:Tfp pilus assembly protein PilN